MLRTFPHSSWQRRDGVTTIDMLVSATLLMAVLTMTSTLCFRIQQIWKGISYQRVATNELANQLEYLTRLDLDDVRTALENLQASDQCAQTLREPDLTGELFEDELGMRLTLQLSWQANPKRQFLQMSGWLIMAGPEPEDDDSAGNVDDDPKDSGNEEQDETEIDSLGHEHSADDSPNLFVMNWLFSEPRRFAK